ncbi:hypothetical protein [Mesorhizobium sp. M4A.F.Ca.ET.022.05.2.1]|nr:hypothetical protein [Mesorhizobium sp. M4A.F.Ca.ET.022.05.2.1]
MKAASASLVIGPRWIAQPGTAGGSQVDAIGDMAGRIMAWTITPSCAFR